MYVHEQNINSKINSNYKNIGQEIENFKNKHYIPFKQKAVNLKFHKNSSHFPIFAKILNDYYSKVLAFSKKHNITSQSKFESTLLEEISMYLFKDLPEIDKYNLGFYNKSIYTGLKFDKDAHITTTSKDVDFCIGKKCHIQIDSQKPIQITLPLICVEVKTYLDATMFGEIKSSSKTLKSGTPSSHCYILLGYKCIADSHIIAARQDTFLDEIFVLRKDRNSLIDADTIEEYYYTIKNDISRVLQAQLISTPGKLLHPENINTPKIEYGVTSIEK